MPQSVTCLLALGLFSLALNLKVVAIDWKDVRVTISAGWNLFPLNQPIYGTLNLTDERNASIIVRSDVMMRLAGSLPGRVGWLLKAASSLLFALTSDHSRWLRAPSLWACCLWCCAGCTRLHD